MARYLSSKGQKEAKKIGLTILTLLAVFATVTAILLLVNIYHPFIGVDQAVDSGEQATEAVKSLIRSVR